MRLVSLLALLGLAAGLFLPACASIRKTTMTDNTQMQDGCGFVTNIYGQRLSWKGQTPIAIELHESVEESMIPAIQRAMDDWEHALGKKVFTISVVGSKGDKRLNHLKDGRNVIYNYKQGEWFGKKDDQAKTYISWVGNQIQEADVVLNSQDYKFSAADVLAKNTELDLESIMVHELGHVLGLDHDNAKPSVMSTWLAAGEKRRAVYKADVAALQCEYSSME